MLQEPIIVEYYITQQTNTSRINHKFLRPYISTFVYKNAKETRREREKQTKQNEEDLINYYRKLAEILPSQCEYVK